MLLWFSPPPSPECLSNVILISHWFLFGRGFWYITSKVIFKMNTCKDPHSVSKNKLHKYRLEEILFYRCVCVKVLRKIQGFLFVLWTVWGGRKIWMWYQAEFWNILRMKKTVFLYSSLYTWNTGLSSRCHIVRGTRVCLDKCMEEMNGACVWRLVWEGTCSGCWLQMFKGCIWKGNWAVLYSIHLSTRFRFTGYFNTIVFILMIMI